MKQQCLRQWASGSEREWSLRDEKPAVNPPVVPGGPLERISGKWHGDMGAPLKPGRLRSWASGVESQGRLKHLVFLGHGTIDEIAAQRAPEIYRGSPLNFQQRGDQTMYVRELCRLERKVLRSIKRNNPRRGTRQGIAPISTNQKGNTIVYGVPWMLNTQKAQFSSVAQSCPTLCDPMNCSTPGLHVHHQLPELTQTHAHRVGDTIQPSHPLSSPPPPAPNPCQHQGLFQWVNSLHEVPKVLEFQLQHQSLQWTPRTDLF